MIKFTRRLLLGLWALGMLILGLWIGYENSAPIQVVLLGNTLPLTTLGVCLSVTFTVGILCGFAAAMLATTGKVFKHKRRANKALKENARLKLEEPAK